MAVQHPVIANVLHLISARMVAQLARVVYVLLLARWLGPSQYGLFIYGQAWYGVYLPLIALGTKEVVVRSYGRDRRSGVVVARQVLALELTVLPFAILVCGGSAWLTEDDPYARALLLVGCLALVGRALSIWAEQVFVAAEESSRTLLQHALFAPLEVLAGLTVLMLDGGVLGLMAVHATVWWLQALRGFWLVNRDFFAPLPVPPRDWRHFVRRGTPALLTTLTLAWMTSGPMVIARHVLGQTADLGHLALALQALQMLSVYSMTVGLATLPKLSRLARGEGADLDRYRDRLVTSALTVATLGVLLAAVAGRPAVTMALGPRFGPAGDLLATVLTTLLPLWAAILLAHDLQARERLKLVSGAAVAANLTWVGVAALLAGTQGVAGLLVALVVGATVWFVALSRGSCPDSTSRPPWSWAFPAAMGLSGGLCLLSAQASTAMAIVAVAMAAGLVLRWFPASTD